MKKPLPAAVLAILTVVLAAAMPAASAGEAPNPDKPKLAPWTAEDILLAESAGQWESSPDGFLATLADGALV